MPPNQPTLEVTMFRARLLSALIAPAAFFGPFYLTLLVLGG